MNTWSPFELGKTQNVSSLSIDAYLIEHPASTYLVRVTGESMLRAGILPGDVVIVDRSRKPKWEEIAVVSINGRVFIRTIERENTTTLLRAKNPSYPSMVAPETMEILGVVTWVIRKYG